MPNYTGKSENTALPVVWIGFCLNPRLVWLRNLVLGPLGHVVLWPGETKSSGEHEVHYPLPVLLHLLNGLHAGYELPMQIVV